MEPWGFLLLLHDSAIRDSVRGDNYISITKMEISYAKGNYEAGWICVGFPVVLLYSAHLP